MNRFIRALCILFFILICLTAYEKPWNDYCVTLTFSNVTTGKTEYYYKEVRPRTEHAICAHLYEASVPPYRWAAEIPQGINHKTKMSVDSILVLFETQESALKYIQRICPVR